jgi:hypothetical protein
MLTSDQHVQARSVLTFLCSQRWMVSAVRESQQCTPLAKVMTTKSCHCDYMAMICSPVIPKGKIPYTLRLWSSLC